MRVYSGEAPYLCISVPPQHGKSTLISEHFTSWWLGNHPEDRIIFVTMQERFSRGWGRKSRDAFFQNAPTLWPGLTTWSRASTACWEVFRDGRRTGGNMQSVGAGGTVTGLTAQLVVVDDLIRNIAEARNATIQEQNWDWFRSAVLTRINPPGRGIILSTRWDHMDIIGRLKAQQEKGEGGVKWEFINLPAIAEEDDPMGRKPGEALWPERYPLEFLKAREKDVGPYIWGSLYQGRPVPASGAIFKKEWFRYYDHGDRVLEVPGRGVCYPSDLQTFVTVDLAASTKKRGKYTAMLVFGYHAAWKSLFLLEVVRERFGPDRIIPAMDAVKARYPKAPFYVEREGLLAPKLGNLIRDAVRAGIPCVELKPNGDKLARAISATGPVAAGQVFLRKGSKWLSTFELELLSFTGNGDAFSDQVDAFTYGIGIFQERSAVAPEAPQVDSPDQPKQGWRFEERRW